MDSKKIKIIAAIMVSMFLGAVEGTVVTTAIPTIAKDLHGFESISFIFSAYLLTSAISTPIYGKLSDLYGRKHMLSIGIIIFLTGSFLCGLSQNIYMLIGFRALQGLGAGALFTVTYTIVGDVFTLEERPKVQGGLGTVWGVASLVGPFLGGTLIDVLSWHWIFYINIPFGILAIILIEKNLEEDFEKKKHSIDFIGIITLSIAMILFLNLFLTTNISFLNEPAFKIISILITILLLFVFYRAEKKAKEPIIPFDILTANTNLVNLVSFFVCVILIATDVYIPIYIQNVLGYGATISGLALVSMSFSWLISSVVLGKCIVKQGGIKVTILSNCILLGGIALLPTLGINSSLWLLIIYAFIIGFGFGGALTTLTIIIQDSVEYQKRGAAISTNSLIKTIGQTIGISIFGSIFNKNIRSYFEEIGIKGINPNDLYGSAAQTGDLTIETIKKALNSSLHNLFLILIVIAIVTVLLSFYMRQVEKRAGN